MAGRQFIVEPLDCQGFNARPIGGGTFNPVGSRTTGIAPSTAASFSKVNGDNLSSTASGSASALPSVKVVDSSGVAVSGTSVSFIASANSGVVTGAQQTTNASGVATVGSWSFGTIAGTQRLEVKAGSLSTQTFTATITAGSAYSIAISAGNNQSIPVAMEASRLTVLVEDAWRNPVSGFTPTWEVTDLDASIQTGSATGATGVSGVSYTAGPTAGVANVQAVLSSVSSVQFTVTSTVSVAAIISIVQGDGQVGEISTLLSVNPQVSVTDAFNNAITGSQVTWVAGAGSLSTARTPTSSAGTAATAWTLGASQGTQLLTARGDFLSASTVTFTVSASTPAASTIALFGGNNQSALAGATLASRLTVRLTTASGASAVGANVDWTVSKGTLGATAVVTDADGYAGVTYSVGTTAGTSIVTATSSGLTGSPVAFTVSVLTQQASSLTLVTQPSSNVNNAQAFSQQPVVQIIDLYGNSNLSNNITVTAAIASGTGVLGGTAAVASGSTGRVFYSGLSITGPGTANTLQFTASGLTAVTSNTITVAPPVGTKLAFTVQPSAVNTGTVITPAVVVAVQDDNGTTVTSATDAVTMAIGSGTGTLSGTLTINAVNGLATFSNLQIDTAGAFTLSASATGLTGATSASFTVTAATNNEPAGLTQLTVRPFDAVTEDSWVNNGTASFSILAGTAITDGTASCPESGSNVLKQVFNSGRAAGTSPNKMERIWQGSAGKKNEVYVRYWVQYGNTNARSNKFIYITSQNGNKNPVFTSSGLNQTNPQFSISLQNCIKSLGGNDSAGAQIINTGVSHTIGQWHKWEVYLKINTFDVADGLLKLWGNGTLLVNRTNMAYRGTTSSGFGATDAWSGVKWDPIMGGSGTLAVGYNIYVDHLYASGA